MGTIPLEPSNSGEEWRVSAIRNDELIREAQIRALQALAGSVKASMMSVREFSDVLQRMNEAMRVEDMDAIRQLGIGDSMPEAQAHDLGNSLCLPPPDHLEPEVLPAVGSLSGVRQIDVEALPE